MLGMSSSWLGLGYRSFIINQWFLNISVLSFCKSLLEAAHMADTLIFPGRRQWGGAKVEVWATGQWRDRDSPKGCGQLYDRPRQGMRLKPTHISLFMHLFETSCSESVCVFSFQSAEVIPALLCPPIPLGLETSAATSYCLFIPHISVFYLFASYLCSLNSFVLLLLLCGTLASWWLIVVATGCTHARLSGGRVIPRYVSSPDVLLTSIDFHLFLLWRFLSSFSPPSPSCGKKRAHVSVRDIAAEILLFYILSDCL